MFSQKIGISNKIIMYIMNSYLIDVHSSKYRVAVFDMHDFLAILEACIGVLGIQDICHFTSRDIGYYPFYF